MSMRTIALASSNMTRQRLCELCLSDARGAEEEEAPDRPSADEPGVVSSQGVRDALDDVLVPDDVLHQALLEIEEALPVSHEQLVGGEPGELTDERCDERPRG